MSTTENILLGAHVSAAGGVPEAPLRAGELDATAMVGSPGTELEFAL